MPKTILNQQITEFTAFRPKTVTNHTTSHHRNKRIHRKEEYKLSIRNKEITSALFKHIQETQLFLDIFVSLLQGKYCHNFGKSSIVEYSIRTRSLENIFCQSYLGGKGQKLSPKRIFYQHLCKLPITKTKFEGIRSFL